jgi:hypothetical protein
MKPKEHWRVISMSLGMGLATSIGVFFGDTSVWVPLVVALGAYGLGWATHLLRGVRTPKQ